MPGQFVMVIGPLGKESRQRLLEILQQAVFVLDRHHGAGCSDDEHMRKPIGDHRSLHDLSNLLGEIGRAHLPLLAGAEGLPVEAGEPAFEHLSCSFDMPPIIGKAPVPVANQIRTYW
jgi:hypothetical protein